MKEKFEEYKIISLIVVMAVFGSTGAFFKISLREMPIDLFTFLRFFFALLVFLPYLLKQQDSAVVTNKKRLILISLIGALNVFLFVWGLNHTTAIISGMLYAAVPLVTAVLALAIIKEKVSLKKWSGILVGFFGVLVIVAAPILRGASGWDGTFFGNFLILLAVLAFCLYSVLSKKYSGEFSPVALTKYFIVTNILVQFVFLLFHPGTFRILDDISLPAWLSVIYCGALGTTLYYFIYQYVIKRASPVLASTTFFLQPLAGIMWASLLIGERVTPVFFVGSIFIFLGMGLVFHEQYSKSGMSA